MWRLLFPETKAPVDFIEDGFDAFSKLDVHHVLSAGRSWPAAPFSDRLQLLRHSKVYAVDDEAYSYLCWPAITILASPYEARTWSSILRWWLA